MLLNLEILNGDLSPEFDKYTDIYTVNISKDINELIFNYEIEEGYEINIVNNNSFKEGSNFVYLEIKNEEEMNVYTLEVYKEYSKDVFIYDDLITKVEVQPKMPEYMPYAIFGTCFFLILIFFFVLFKPFKRKK